jgi:imidazolonepropionase-like amidohydrolase
MRFYRHWAKRPTDSLAASLQRTAEDTPYHRIAKVLHDAGAGLLLGSDAGVSGMVPGFSIHRELEALVKAGLTPYEALATGTRNAATYFGTLNSTGTIAVGKRADLVLLQGNPLQDIRNTGQPAGVMIGGRWVARADLDARLQALEGTLE